MPELLTDTELELVHVLWERGPSTAREVKDALAGERAYTTVSTLLRILEKKGFVSVVDREARTHRYAPALERGTYEARGVDHVVRGVFRGSPVQLVRALVDGAELDRAQLEALRDLVDARLAAEREPR